MTAPMPTSRLRRMMAAPDDREVETVQRRRESYARGRMTELMLAEYLIPLTGEERIAQALIRRLRTGSGPS